MVINSEERMKVEILNIPEDDISCFKADLNNICERYDAEFEEIEARNDSTVEEMLKIAMSAWKRCYTAYDIQLNGMTYDDSAKELLKDGEWKKVNEFLSRA